MPKSPLSQRDWTRLRRAWEAGLSYAELARFSGLSAHAIGRHARKEGWNRDKTEPATDRALNIDTPLNTAATLFSQPHADSPPENSPIELNTRAALAEVTSRLERLQPDDE